MPAEDVNEPQVVFSPEAMEEAAGRVDKLRGELLFDIDAACAAPDAEQLFLLALTCLEQARANLKLAQYAQSRALV